MLRALLFGVLTVMSAASCSKKADAPAVAVGAAAGKVVEITGKVSATREGKARELAMGGEVFRDDEIATSDNATVTIELFHNNAKWAVVSNKTARVDASLAWGLDKQEASKTVEHNSAAAGRNAERSAADTASTAGRQDSESAPASAEPPLPPAPGAAPITQPVAPPVGGANEERGGGNASPPPPPPPPPKPARTAKGGSREMSAPKDVAQAPLANSAPADGKAGDDKKVEREKAAAVITPQARAERERPALQQCLDKATDVSVKISVRKNTTTTSSKGTNLTAKERACIDAVIKKIEWPVPGTTFELTLKL